MAEQVKTMKLKVDLECQKCYKKVKKVLCKFPEIRDQVYDQKQNIVTIKVVSCNPERIRDKLCCKGGGSIKRIEIVDPPKPKPKPEPNNKAVTEKPKEPPKKEQPKSPPDEPPKQEQPKSPSDEPPLLTTPATPTPTPQAMFPEPAPVSVLAYPPPMAAIPVGVYYEGHAGYGGYYRRPIDDSYGGGGRPGYMSRGDQYWSEENASGCTIV